MSLKQRCWRRLSLLGIFGVATAAYVLFLLCGRALDSEPSYQGKRLSVWLRKASGYSVLHTQMKVVVPFGTNAIPFLLKMASRHDSCLKENLIRFDQACCSRLFGRLSATVYHRFGGICADESHELATLGFWALGRDAKPAVPGLIKLLDHSDPEIARGAVLDLAGIGPAAAEAVPALLRICQDTSPGRRLLRGTSMGALGAIVEHAPVVVPVLLQVLAETNSHHEDVTACALGEFGANALVAVPQLRRLTSHPEWSARCRAAEALSKIDPMGSWDAAGPVLVSVLESEEDADTEDVLPMLPRFGTNAMDAIPALERFAARSPFFSYSNSAMATLRLIRQDAARAEHSRSENPGQETESREEF